VVIPNRAFFKAAEVCEFAQVQPYVLRTWEIEFPSLGVPRPGGGPRIYRRQDVERVLEIKQLVFAEGLTLSGARRRLEGDAPPPSEEPSIEALITPEVREKLATVRRGLQSIMTILGPATESRGAESETVTERREPVERDLFSGEGSGRVAVVGPRIVKPKRRGRPAVRGGGPKGTRQGRAGR